jgi:hypothetical protein
VRLAALWRYGPKGPAVQPGVSVAVLAPGRSRHGSAGPVISSAASESFSTSVTHTYAHTDTQTHTRTHTHTHAHTSVRTTRRHRHRHTHAFSRRHSHTAHTQIHTHTDSLADTCLRALRPIYIYDHAPRTKCQSSTAAPALRHSSTALPPCITHPAPGLVLGKKVIVILLLSAHMAGCTGGPGVAAQDTELAHPWGVMGGMGTDVREGVYIA